MHLTSKPLLIIGALLASNIALAQGPSKAAAEALFQEGRALFEQGKFQEGCPKLAESQRIDPATGTLLALALCHEGEGKLASAWSEFTTVEGQARQAGRDDREAIAREHAAALRPRLSTLTVEVTPEVAATPGLEVRVNGAQIGAGSFGSAVPVDGGEHRVEASAPGKKPWLISVSGKTELDALRVSIPALVDAAGSETAAPQATPAASGDEASVEPNSGSGMRTAGLITAGAGVIAIGVGSYFALDAKSDYDAADKECSGNVCPDPSYEATEDARAQGTLATVLFAVGGAAIAAGVTLWLLAPDGKKSEPAAVRVERIGLGPGGVILRGSY